MNTKATTITHPDKRMRHMKQFQNQKEDLLYPQLQTKQVLLCSLQLLLDLNSELPFLYVIHVR